MPKKGYKLTEEHKKKLSEAHKGNYQSKEIRKKISETKKGCIFTLEHRRKLSKARKGKRMPLETIIKISISKAGEKSPTWLGGKRLESYNKGYNNQLRESIRKRDGYRCQMCFINQKDIAMRKQHKRALDTHHVDYNKQNDSPNNLISLCSPCHTKTNFKRECWQQHFEEMII